MEFVKTKLKMKLHNMPLIFIRGILWKYFSFLKWLNLRKSTNVIETLLLGSLPTIKRFE